MRISGHKTARCLNAATLSQRRILPKQLRKIDAFHESRSQNVRTLPQMGANEELGELQSDSVN